MNDKYSQEFYIAQYCEHLKTKVEIGNKKAPNNAFIKCGVVKREDKERRSITNRGTSKKLTLHLQLMHFCSPAEATTGCHSSPLGWCLIGDLQPPFAMITWGDRRVPVLEPRSRCSFLSSSVTLSCKFRN